MFRYNFSDMEIEMFFAKYDMDDDNVFGSEEGLKILKDIDDDKLYGPAEVGRRKLCFLSECYCLVSECMS